MRHLWLRRHLIGAALGCALTTLAVPAGPAGAATLPATPVLHVSSGTSGTYLTWTASGATRFQLQQATNSQFTRRLRTYTDRDGRDRQFTPYGLAKGTTYYFRIRALHGSTAGHFSHPVHAVVLTREQPIRVEQFNVSNEDGTRDAGGVVLYWSQRRLAVAGIIRQAHPDVLAIEEAAGWVGRVKGPRIADDIASLLGSPYTLARTEIPPGQPGWFRTGDYLIYNSLEYAPIQTGGHWQIGTTASPAFEVYQLLRNRATGARCLFIGAHLSATSGRAGDALRVTETNHVIANATAYAAAHGHPPIIYAGDFNSNDGSNHYYDGPGVATRAAHIADGFKTAQTMVNSRYDSANNYYRTPPAFSRSIDRLFAPPGVAITAWRQYLNLSGGKFAGVIPSDHNPVAADLTIPF